MPFDSNAFPVQTSTASAPSDGLFQRMIRLWIEHHERMSGLSTRLF